MKGIGRNETGREKESDIREDKIRTRKDGNETRAERNRNDPLSLHSSSESSFSLSRSDLLPSLQLLPTTIDSSSSSSDSSSLSSSDSDELDATSTCEAVRAEGGGG